MKTVLLTNDDGFFSLGITSLKDLLSERYRVFVVAPDRERSAVSMGLTLHYPLRISEVEERVFAIDGTTADCVNIALQKLLPERPDFVVSGMNLGENLAEDIFFSGTVGGAFSALLYGIPSMAVSLIAGSDIPGQDPIDFAAAASISERVLERLLNAVIAPAVYNLNIPFPNKGEIAVTTLGRKRYTPDIIERHDPRGKKYFWIGTGIPTYDGDEGTDVWAVKNQFISLSAIQYDLNFHQENNRLKKLLEETGFSV